MTFAIKSVGVDVVTVKLLLIFGHYDHVCDTEPHIDEVNNNLRGFIMYILVSALH
jgi:hypothetical protein